MNYVLQGQHEPERLEKQSSCDHYSIAKELSNILIPPGSKVLDAACGTGLVCRYLHDNYQGLEVYGCDFSKSSLEFAAQSDGKTTYYNHDLLNVPLTAKYDLIINRYCSHHFKEDDYKKVLNNFYQALNPGGRLVIIDIDGLFANICTKNQKILTDVNSLKSEFPGDVYLPRKMAKLSYEVGFSIKDYTSEVITFTQNEKKNEAKQWTERFLSAIELLNNVFKNEISAQRFIREYETELFNVDSFLYYTKHILIAEKKYEL